MSSVSGCTGGPNGAGNFDSERSNSDTSSCVEDRVDEVARVTLTSATEQTVQACTDELERKTQFDEIVKAIEQNNENALKQLLEKGGISEENRNKAIMLAVENKNIYLYECLLGSNPLPEKFRCELIVLAIEHEYPELYEKLLGDGHMSYDLANAMNRAAYLGLTPVVNLLLENNDVFDDMLLEAARNAAVSCEADVLRFLLEGFPLDESQHDSIVESLAAEEVEYDKFGRSLIALWDIGFAFTEDQQSDLINYLAASGNEVMMRSILNENSIPIEDRSRAINTAVENGHSTVIPLLLRDGMGNFIRMDISEALLQAVDLGKRDLVEALLANVPSIPSVLRDSARTNVQGAEREAILDLLEQVVIDDSSEAMRETTLHGEWIGLEEMESNPLILLQKIAVEGMPRRFCLIESPQSVDLGGITKQVMTVLVDALLDKKLLKTDGVLRLPILEERDSGEILQQFGQFLCQLDSRNQNRTDKFLIGARWSPELFELLKLEERLSSTEILVRLVEERGNPRETFLIELLRNPTDKKALVEYSEAYVCGSVESARQEFCKWRNSMEKAVAALRSGLTSKFKEKLQRMDAKDFSDQIQGVEASAEMIIAAFKLKEVPTNSLEKFKERVQWLRDWILGADEKTRKSFLMALTGRNVLGKGTKIAIGWGLRENGAVELHTCFNSINFPNANELKKEDFLAAVHFASEQKNYTIA